MSIHSAPSNLLLAVRRIADLLDVRRIASAGPLRLELGDGPEVVAAAGVDAAIVEASRGGVALLSGGASWRELDAARAIVAVDPDPAGSALDALAAISDAATAAGRRVVHASVLHTATADGAAVRREWPLVVACGPDDEAFAQALAAGPLSLALDPAVDLARDAGRPARVLIASYEIAGPTGNGGIGTAYHSLAHALAAAGHDVTVLFTGWIDPAQGAREAEWRRRFAEKGIAFSFLGTPWDLPIRSPHHAVRRAYELHRWLAEEHAERPFDVVHLPECIGHAAFALTAKRLGLAYADVEFAIGTHSSTRWVAECNREPIENLDMLVTEHLERLSVELADVVMSPTAYLVDYMRDRAWELPERTFVQPLARPRSVQQGAGEAPARSAAEELVFFGRLETRKGLEVFCDAVDLLAAGGCPYRRVTFLGRPEQVMGEDAAAFVARRAEAWGVAWEILPDYGHDQAIAYLRERPCVVAIPSLVDNSPNTVIEVVALGVPFVASRSGGTAELIAAGDLATSTFDGWHASRDLEPPAFDDEQAPFDAEALASALRAKAGAPGRRPAAAVSDADCDRIYDAWHRAIAARCDARRAAPPAAPRSTPDAAVCIVAPEAGDVRRIAAALDAGTQAPTATVAICSEAPAEPSSPGVELVVAAGRAAGPARRQALAALDAEVLIVLRGEETPDRELVERTCAAMAAADADVLALVCRDPDADRDAGTAAELARASAPADLRAFVPTPGPALAGAAYPALAVGPYAIRRTALERIGGFAADAWGEACDRELLARAALAGLRIDVLPDPLATSVRDDRWSALRTRYWGEVALPAPHGEELARILRPYRRRLDGALADLPGLLVGALRGAGSGALERAEHVRAQAELVEAYERRIAEFGELVAIYERRIIEQDALLAQQPPPSPRIPDRVRDARVVRGLRRGLRKPISAAPGRALRFARWQLKALRRR